MSEKYNANPDFRLKFPILCNHVYILHRANTVIFSEHNTEYEQYCQLFSGIITIIDQNNFQIIKQTRDHYTAIPYMKRSYMQRIAWTLEHSRNSKNNLIS